MGAKSLVKETITVTEPVAGKFGPQVRVGKEYYSFGRGYKGIELAANGTYDVDVEVTEKGYKYIIGATLVGSAPAPSAAPLAAGNKDARILAQGLWQAAIQAPALAALAGDSEALIKLANEIALAGMEFVKAHS